MNARSAVAGLAVVTLLVLWFRVIRSREPGVREEPAVAERIREETKRRAAEAA